MKAKFILTIFLIFLYATSNYALAQEITLTALLNSVTSMAANFTQTIYDDQGQVVQENVGNMYLQRPGKFRWQVRKPIAQLIIAKDKKIWIYDPDLEQVTIRNLSNNQSDTPALLLSHVDSALANKFDFRSLPAPKANWHWYELKPKQKDSMFAWIKMGFYQNQIKEMQLQDHLDHYTVIKFNNIKMNSQLSASLFELKIPKNTDVIDETKNRS